MIVPRAVVLPLLLLVAMATTSIAYNAGIGQAPLAFFGDGETLLIAPTDQLPGQAEIDASLVAPMRALPGVRVVSPEIYAPTTIDGRSVMVRGVDVASFMLLEEARLVAGRLPGDRSEALVGAGAARLLDVAPGDPLVLVGAKAAAALPVRIVGVIEAETPVRDEVIVQLETARVLGRLEPNEAHVIRVSAEDRRSVLETIDSIVPAFTYSDVRLSSTEVLPGEPVEVLANLTNWGRVTGLKTVEVRQGDEVLAQVNVVVGPRATVPVRVPFHLTQAGATNVTLNPTLSLVVRAPSLSLQGLPPWGVQDDVVQVRVVDNQGAPVANARVLGQGIDATADAEGHAQIAFQAAGHQRLSLHRDGREEATVRVFVAPREDADITKPLVHRFQADAYYVSANGTLDVVLDVENVGGRKDLVVVPLTVDGEVVGQASADIAPGQRGRVTATIGPLPPGEHVLGAGGWDGVWRVLSVEGDPAVEAILRAYASPREPSGTAPVTTGEADDYIQKILGNVGAAVLALSVAGGLLAALAAGVVLRRHLAERATSLGTLKALGANHEWIVELATREALLRAAAASAGGVLLGILGAEMLDALGWIRAFGHAVHPAYSAPSLLLVFVLSTGLLTLTARAIVAGMLQTPADGLLRGRDNPAADAPPEELATLLWGKSS